MKLVTISGAHAAGKNEIAKIQFAAFGENVLHRMVPCTTRKPRNGEVHGREYYYLEEDEFERLFQDDQFVYHVHIRKHRSGTIWSEFIRNEISLVDITPEGARCMRDLIRNEGLGSAFLIFVDAPPPERKARILRRQPDLHPDAVDKMISLDPGLSQQSCRSR